MQKGYKRNGKGMAVLRFFIGLIIVAILAGVAYFFLNRVDYSDRIASTSATMRAYVEMTETPEVTPEPTVEAVTETSADNAAGDELVFGDMSDADFGDTGESETAEENSFVDISDTPTPEPTEEPTATPEPTEEPTPEPTPTVEPTATPEPTPIPTATPEPTKIPVKQCASLHSKGVTLPSASNDAVRAITNFYVSEPNGNRVFEARGYAYMDNASFDASNLKLALVVINATTGTKYYFACNMEEGASGDPHTGAVCQNPSKSDFRVLINCMKWKNGTYSMGLLMKYTMNGTEFTTYQELPNAFTVTDNVVAEVPETYSFTGMASDDSSSELSFGAADTTDDSVADESADVSSEDAAADTGEESETTAVANDSNEGGANWFNAYEAESAEDTASTETATDESESADTGAVTVVG